MRRNFLRSLSFLWTVAVVVHLDYTQAILSECTFTGTSGFCAGVTGRFIRPVFNNNIRVLYIVNSNLNSLIAKDFRLFQNLTSLYINNCSIPRSIPPEESLLSGLKNLKVLQITYSDLSEDVRFMFVNNTNINNLSLQWNRLTRITKDTFTHLKRIEGIDISHNEISEIEEGAFNDMPYLTKLNISYNKIGEHFNLAYLTLPSGTCDICGERCSTNEVKQCPSNEGTDHLWRNFEGNYEILYLEGNPLCSKIGNQAIDYGARETTGIERPVPGCTSESKSCPKHEKRKTFFFRVCNQYAFDEKRRVGKYNVGDNENLDSAPVVDGLNDSGVLLESEEFTEGTETRSSSEAGDTHGSVVGGSDDGEPKLPPSSVEVEGTMIPDPAGSETEDDDSAPVVDGLDDSGILLESEEGGAEIPKSSEAGDPQVPAAGGGEVGDSDGDANSDANGDVNGEGDGNDGGYGDEDDDDGDGDGDGDDNGDTDGDDNGDTGGDWEQPPSSVGDGGDDDDSDLPLSSVEVADAPPAKGLALITPRSAVLILATVVTVPGVIVAVIVGARRKKYTSVATSDPVNDEDNVFEDLKVEELEDGAAKEPSLDEEGFENVVLE